LAALHPAAQPYRRCIRFDEKTDSMKNQIRLNAATMKSLPSRVARPRYDRATAGIGIVHIGVGAFHKAHQAVYTDDAMAYGGGDWAIAGISLIRPDNRNQLAPQDCLYTVGERDNDGETLRVIGAIRQLLVAAENPAAALAQLARPDVGIVTLTITEKGYCLRPDNGALDLDHPAIRHDLDPDNAPRSAIGYLGRALALRRMRGSAAPTILSCDNLPDNGVRLRDAVLCFTRSFDAATADWCAEQVRFPSSMVDRIVPAPTAADRLRFQSDTGMSDAAFVKTEPFRQWIIEDDFNRPRPAWEAGGAQFVRDVTPFETAKLRLLNGAHSAIAYLACLAGYAYVDQAMTNPPFARFIQQLMEQEIAPTLVRHQDLNLPAYMSALTARFNNRALQHRTLQIAADGSQKLPARLLPTIRERLAAGAAIDRLALVVAAWMRCLAGTDDNGEPIALADPLAERLTKAARGHGEPGHQVRSLLRLSTIFGHDLPADARFVGAVTDWLASLANHGVEQTLRAVIAR
jgi:fructuronate reductase